MHTLATFDGEGDTPDNDDTIVAIATPPGRGGIGILRLSGPDARPIAEPLLKLRHPLAPSHARFAEVLDSTGETLDEAVVTYFAAPHSYTSEDVVEIAAHGSPVLLEDLLRRTIAAGARLAEPGEFTQRAFLSGRLDLTQAEAVHDLIESQTLHQARIAARQLGGSVSRLIAPIKDNLIALIASLEAGIDFAAEDNPDDIDVLPSQQIATRIAAIQTPLTDLEHSFAYGRILRDGLTLAIVGRPNAGKSSLFNRLVQSDRAIVTPIPGTTRDLITERIAIDGILIHLVDTAGIRTSADRPADEAESIGIAKSREAIADADVVLLVLDATQPHTDEDAALYATLASQSVLIAHNKSDLPAASTTNTFTHPTIQTSAVTGSGIPELRAAILAQAGSGAAPESAVLTNLRQQQAVTAATAALTRAHRAIENRIPHEMLLLDLYEALHSLDALTGATTSDDILALIFSKFCIGK